MQILLVEPDRILASIYTEALRREGHTVHHAYTAQAAITRADAHTPDVVLLEMQLAGHSGAAFLYEFRTYSDWLTVPVIVHTLIPPINLEVFEQTFRELGIHNCLYKPRTSLRQLIRAVNACAPVKS